MNTESVNNKLAKIEHFILSRARDSHSFALRKNSEWVNSFDDIGQFSVLRTDDDCELDIELNELAARAPTHWHAGYMYCLLSIKKQLSATR